MNIEELENKVEKLEKEIEGLEKELEDNDTLSDSIVSWTSNYAAKSINSNVNNSVIFDEMLYVEFDGQKITLKEYIERKVKDGIDKSRNRRGLGKWKKRTKTKMGYRPFTKRRNSY